MAEFERDPNEIGALWLRDGQRGQFLSGQINGVDVICFPVNSDNPRAPAWRVLKSQPRDGQQPHGNQRDAPPRDRDNRGGRPENNGPRYSQGERGQRPPQRDARREPARTAPRQEERRYDDDDNEPPL